MSDVRAPTLPRGSRVQMDRLDRILADFSTLLSETLLLSEGFSLQGEEMTALVATGRSARLADRCLMKRNAASPFYISLFVRLDLWYFVVNPLDQTPLYT